MPSVITGPYQCTTTAQEEVSRACCFGCKQLGPVSESQGGAIDRAECEGWRTFNGYLFCRECRRDAAGIISRREFDAKLGDDL